MERLLVVKLDVQDCEAEVCVNGIPLARAHAGRPRAIVPLHEYTLAGANRLELTVWPHPVTALAATTAGSQDATLPPALPLVSRGTHLASARILLPRIGSPADEGSARTLAHLEWAPPSGTGYEAPVALTQELSLPVSFPRWRWLDAPPVQLTPALHAQALAFVQAIAQDLAAGQTERLLNASRLRTEELAVAYQRQPQDEAARLREHLLALHAEGRLVFTPFVPAGFFLRPVAGARLLECLDAAGGPALRTAPDARGATWALPLRMAHVEGKFYVLR